MGFENWQWLYPKDFPHHVTTCLKATLPKVCFFALRRIQAAERRNQTERRNNCSLVPSDNIINIHLILFILEQHMHSCCLTKLCNIMHNKGLTHSLPSLTRGVKKMSKLLTRCYFEYFKSMQHEPGLWHVPLFGQHPRLSIWIVCMKSVLGTRRIQFAPALLNI